MRVACRTHRERHEELRDALDELVTDYLLHHPRQRHVRGLVVQRLLDWAIAQAAAPTLPPDGLPHHNGCQFDEADEEQR
jgi:hypothetical protein